MKKILLIIIGIILTETLMFNQLVFAGTKQYGDDCDTNSDCADGLICRTFGKDTNNKLAKICDDLVSALTQRPFNPDVDVNVKGKDDSKYIRALPDVSLEGGMTLAIKAMLRSAMYLTIIAIVVAAIYYIISRGKDEDMTKAKDIILYLVIGMAIIAAAYGVVAGVTQFNVFG